MSIYPALPKLQPQLRVSADPIPSGNQIADTMRPKTHRKLGSPRYHQNFWSVSDVLVFLGQYHNNPNFEFDRDSIPCTLYTYIRSSYCTSVHEFFVPNGHAQ